VKDMITFDLHQQADAVYEEYSSSGNVTRGEEMRKGCLYVESFVHWCNYAYLVEEVNEVLLKGWNYSQYKSIVKERRAQEVLDGIHERFVLKCDELSDDDMLALARLYHFVCSQKNLEFWTREQASPFSSITEQTLDVWREEVVAHLNGLKRGCTEKELKVVSMAYDIYLERSKSKKEFNRDEKWIFPIIEEAYHTWNSVTNEKNEIYRKGVRMRGAGFSKG